MDACTYESITGLKNYYGFKSLLKNGQWTQRYGCDDDTIVFNRIESFTFNGGGFTLNANQVGVVLNCTNLYCQPALNFFIPELIEALDVDNQRIYIDSNASIVGIAIIGSFQLAYGGQKNLVLAIFDLY
jgi:hypothetical protein